MTAAGHRSLHLLLVEDNPGDARLIQEMLRSAPGARPYVEHVDRLAPALDRLARGGIDVVLLDLKLPDSDGLETLVRAQACAPDVAIVILTALDEERLAVAAVREGAQDYLVKGHVAAESLASAARYAIERKQAQAGLNRRLRQQAVVADLGQQALARRDTSALIDKAVQLVADTLGVEYAEILEAMPSDQALQRRASVGWSADAGALATAGPESLAGHALRSRSPVIAQDLRTESRIGAAPLLVAQGLASGVAVVISGLGVLAVYSAMPRAFSEDEVHFLQTIANVLGLAIGRGRVQDALHTSEERFRSAFEHSGIGMAIRALGGGYVRVNRALCDMLGCTEDELLAATHEVALSEDEAAAAREKDRRMLAGELRSYELERRYVHKRGHEVTALVSVSLIRNPGGQPMSLLLQFQDITQRVQLEQRLRQAHKMEAIGRLAGGVAHDFNNMLTIIVGRSEILLENVRPGDPLHRNVQLIRTTADRASRLTQQLLAFSRQQILQPSVLDLNNVIVGLREMLARLVGEDIELITRLRSPLKPVRADLGQIEQVLVNLAANARDAMPRGGQLVIETAGVELDASFADEHAGAVPGAYVMFAVRDTGLGMDAHTKRQLFEPFFTTKELGHGTGLGLATVYGIVKQHAGYIAVESELGRGSTFRVYLPEVDEAVAATPVGPQARPAGGSETLLLVEDDDSLRDLGREILTAEGYAVLEARSPEEAILLASRHPEPLDLLVTDVVMPQMSGRELADRLAGSHSGLKILYMSGYTDDTISHHGVLDPGVAFLPKPFTPESLLRKVRQVLDAASEDDASR